MEQDQRRPQSMKISTSGRSLAKAKSIAVQVFDLYATQDRQRQPPPIRRPMKMLDKKSSKNLLESARAFSRPQTALEVKTTIMRRRRRKRKWSRRRRRNLPRGNTLESLMTKNAHPLESHHENQVEFHNHLVNAMNFAEQAMAAVKKRKSKRFTTPKKKNVTVVEPTIRRPPVVPVSSRPPVVPVSNKTEEPPKRKTLKIPKRTSSRRLLNRVEKPKEKKLDQVSISSNQLVFLSSRMFMTERSVCRLYVISFDFSTSKFFTNTIYNTQYVQRTNDRVFSR